MKTIRIPLTQGYEAVIDEADYDLVSRFKWHAFVNEGRVYATTRIAIHRLIMNPPPGAVVDHRNSDGLDNRRENLRIANNSQNQWNTKCRKSSSGYKGVSWDKRKKKWVVGIMANGRKLFGGYFENPKEAAVRADQLMREHHGEFARTNFPVK